MAAKATHAKSTATRRKAAVGVTQNDVAFNACVQALHAPSPDIDFKLLAMNQCDATDKELWAQNRITYDRHVSRVLMAVDILSHDLSILFPKKNRRRAEAQAAIRRLRQAVLDRHGYLCGICSAEIPPDDVSIDHIIPISLGGTDDFDNLQPAHRTCNSRKGNRVLTERVDA